MHAFSHAPAALRIFQFAADSAPRVLELTHVSKFLRECAVEFGSADAALPGALRNKYASGRFFKLREIVERNVERCPWLAEKLLRAYRSGAPMPASALAPDVTRYDVKWGAEGARRNEKLQLTHGGFGLAGSDFARACCWAQGPVGATSGKHYFQVCVTSPCDFHRDVALGWVDDKISISANDSTGFQGTHSSGATHWHNSRASAAHWHKGGHFAFGTAPLAADSRIDAPAKNSPCVVGCLLDMDATPARMTVFVDGEPLPVQCDYDFPKDGRAWFPSVALCGSTAALHSCAM
jgi:hypothetical protein